MAYVTVDAPQLDAKNVPRDGRRRDGAARVRPLPRPERRDVEQARRRRGASASTTPYGEDELREWVEPLRELAGESEEAYAFFNNNNQTNGVAQAPAGAQLLAKLLEEEKVPVG